jgi:hypothetical protein
VTSCSAEGLHQRDVEVEAADTKQHDNRKKGKSEKYGTVQSGKY